MDWTELALKVGDDAKDIIEQDRGESTNGGKVVCFMTDHKSNPQLSWLPTKPGDPGKHKCCNCDEVYSLIDHCKWLAHDDMKEAYRLLCEFAGESPAQSTENRHAKPLRVESVPEPAEVTFPAVEPLSDAMFQKGGHYLTGRGISRETLIAYKVTSTTEAIFFNYHVGDTLVKIKGRAIGDMANGQNKYCFTPKGGTNTLYGQHMFNGQQTVAVCEGEIDALSLHTALVENNLDSMILASSVPSGSGSTSWIENSRSFLEKFKAIVLVPDNDAAGEKFTEKAGGDLMMIKPVRIAAMADSGANDINELLQNKGGKAVCTVIANAKEHLPDFTVDLSKLPDVPEVVRYEKSGFYILDKSLRGLRHGLMTLFTGHTGAGKTTILRQMLIFNAGCRRRVGAMMGEETPTMFRDMVLRQAFVKSHPEMFYTPDDEWDNSDWVPKPELVQSFNQHYHPYISHFNCAHLQGIGRLKKLYEWIRFESNIFDTRLFIIDNLMKLEVGIGDNLNSAQGDITDTLKNICSTLNVHIILVAHPKKGQQNLNSESVSGSQKIVNTVDNMVSFQRFDKMDDATGSKIKQHINRNGQYDDITAFLKIEKNRVWAKLATVPMRYDETTNCIHDLAPNGVQTYGFTIPGRTYQPTRETI